MNTLISILKHLLHNFHLSTSSLTLLKKGCHQDRHLNTFMTCHSQTQEPFYTNLHLFSFYDLIFLCTCSKIMVLTMKTNPLKMYELNLWTWVLMHEHKTVHWNPTPPPPKKKRTKPKKIKYIHVHVPTLLCYRPILLSHLYMK